MAMALPIIGIGMTALGGVMSASSSLAQGKAAQQAANYHAQVAEDNATLARQKLSRICRQKPN